MRCGLGLALCFSLGSIVVELTGCARDPCQGVNNIVCDGGDIWACSAAWVSGDNPFGSYQGGWAQIGTCEPSEYCSPHTNDGCALAPESVPECDGGSSSVCSGTESLSCNNGYLVGRTECGKCSAGQCTGFIGGACVLSSDCVPGLDCISGPVRLADGGAVFDGGPPGGGGVCSARCGPGVPDSGYDPCVPPVGEEAATGGTPALVYGPNAVCSVTGWCYLP
jgi:hypothetical protein